MVMICHHSLYNSIFRVQKSKLLRPYSSLSLILNTSSSIQRTRSRSFHFGNPLSSPRRAFFASNSTLQGQPRESESQNPPQEQRRKTTRSPAAKTSLRRVAVEAQRSRDGLLPKKSSPEHQPATKTVTAYCVAEQYDIPHVARILRGHGYRIDPYNTGLYPQVIHIEAFPSSIGNDVAQDAGDVFVFPSGTLVAWSVPESTLLSLVSETLLPAAQNYYSHLKKFEEEDMEYLEDPKKENSSIKGDTIILGTRRQAPELHGEVSDSPGGDRLPEFEALGTAGIECSGHIDTILTKIAYSSGLARSTKLAVLESLLGDYFESTRSIPTMLSRGGRLRFTRSQILQKTGQLLSVRAQLNLYSELTDSLPDLFWDSRYELGLEGYYDQVGRALDIGIRIKVLNEKMDYAQEIASVLRAQLSEKHGLHLEWTIIALIAVEVGFEIRQVMKERRERLESKDHDIALA